ncbi:glucose-6-phosphate isomerase [Ramlibacter tataouinensis]|uniref:glucose-6-phosphate isomerase n=1 Tax=Ramlibacter tataouinensis TaxID=94132 RepID=UPI0022F3AFD3|nr:glucose-6-phosphate isomerase [Ramlibacter tataouinensis]WBY03792.1 glucose-6-phosphate isomerase [Ramlibacter tataouinensis]
MAAPLPPRCDETAAWPALRQHFEGEGRRFDVRRALAADPGRVEAFSLQAPHVFADLSKNLLAAEGERLLLQLARECRLEAQRDAMFAGEAINATEGRQVMHFLLRAPRDEAVPPGLASELAQVHETLEAMLAFAESVRADGQITDIVNIGIGGSDLGPQMATLALDEFVAPDKRFHFVSNIDGHELAGVLRGLKAANTLFLVASKTFTTLETMTNARSARQWFVQRGGTDVARHFAALTTHVQAAAEFGIERTFGFRDWVGGRYSMWSAIGLPIAIAVGAQRFRELLAGAHAMDRHFRSEPLERNLPVRLALLDVWYRDFHGFGSRSVAPYHSALRRLPAYLQQLEMESNGKRVDRQGRVLPYATSPVVWGEPGTNGQHAYFQMLHQGTDVVPVEFIAVKTPAHGLAEHHPQLLANVLAQAAALMLGKDDPGGHKHFPGNRPSTLLLLDRLDPQSLGALIALYEHRVFCAGAIWGINSFDQWGVELGKVLARDIAPRLASGDLAGLDASTAALVRRLRA